MKQVRKPATVWLGRLTQDGGLYELGMFRKKWNTVTGFEMGSGIRSFCIEEFERYSGVQLEPGEVVKVRFYVEEEEA